MKQATIFCLAAILLASGAYAYAQVTILDDTGDTADTHSVIYDSGQVARNSYQRGYNDGFDNGYSEGQAAGIEQGRDDPWNRYYGKCDDLDYSDSVEDWEDCYGYAYPGVYPVVYPSYPVYQVYPAYPVVPYDYSQYSYAPSTCQHYGYSRYC